MCSFCEELKCDRHHSAHIGSNCYQRHPYPYTENDMVIHVDVKQKEGAYYLTAEATAFGEARLIKDQLSMNTIVSSQIYYCPYCGERL